MSVEAYPLQWPEGWPRTKRPTRARFNTSFAAARDNLFDEIRLMRGRSVVLSTNITLRRDGLPYANQPQPDDRGAAVYWTTSDGESRCMACDRWDRVQDNIQALRLSIAALRGLDRWGSSEIVARAFTGFQRLEAPSDVWWKVLGVDHDADRPEVEAAYRRRRAETHPDRPGGDAGEFHRVTKAYQQARGEL